MTMSPVDQSAMQHLTALYETRHALRSGLSQTKRELETARADHTSALRENAQLTILNEELAEEIEELRGNLTLERQQARSAELDSDDHAAVLQSLTDARAANGRLMVQRDKALSEVAEMRETLGRAVDDTANLTQKLQRRDAEIAMLLESNESAAKKLKRETSRADALTANIADRDREIAKLKARIEELDPPAPSPIKRIDPVKAIVLPPAGKEAAPKIPDGYFTPIPNSHIKAGDKVYKRGVGWELANDAAVGKSKVHQYLAVARPRHKIPPSQTPPPAGYRLIDGHGSKKLTENDKVLVDGAYQNATNGQVGMTLSEARKRGLFAVRKVEA